MSGRRLLLDTNAVVALLRGEGGLEASLRSAQWVGISIIRRETKLKLPDAIVAATALARDAMLVTADGDFAKVASLRVSNLF